MKEDDTPIWKMGLKKLWENTGAKVKEEFTETPWKWKNGFEGKILFSQSGDKTFTFGADQNLVSSYNQSTKSANLSALYAQLLKL
jgi:hypothetical protein